MGVDGILAPILFCAFSKYEKHLSLAINICKKVFPDYQGFSESNQWGDPEETASFLICLYAKLYQMLNILQKFLAN